VTDSWIGGDITGIKAMGTAMSTAPAKIKHIVSDLSSGTDKLVGDAGFSGDAADEFKRRWTEDALTAGALAAVIGQIGTVMADLGRHLSTLDASLHDAARLARQAELPLGPLGEPPELTGPVPDNPKAQAQVVALRKYVADYDELHRLAKGFRLAAASELSGLAAKIEPPESGKPLTPDQAVTMGDFVKSLYVIPDEQNRADAKRLPGELDESKAELKAARKDLHAARAKYQADGRKLPQNAAERAAHNEAVREYKGLQSDLAAAEADDGRTVGKILDYSVTDLAKAVPALARATAALPDFLKFAEDIPVIDIAASAVAAGFQVHDDEDKGWSSTEAWLKDGAAGAGGLLAGAGVVALAPEAVPVAAVVVGAGVVVVGVGDLGYQAFHEHWSEDIHDHGVVPGLLDGTGHVFANTGKDLAHMGEGIGHGAEHVAKKVWGWL
jgi:uncharacterized protein YukE